MEMGSITHKAQPYMRPAYEQMRVAFVESMASILRDEIISTQARAARKKARA
jgi:hypothetical protein